MSGSGIMTSPINFQLPADRGGDRIASMSDDWNGIEMPRKIDLQQGKLPNNVKSESVRGARPTPAARAMGQVPKSSSVSMKESFAAIWASRAIYLLRVPLLACPAVLFEHALLDKPAVAPKEESSFIQGRIRNDKNFNSLCKPFAGTPH
jgi:hypothetical protein